MYTASLLWYSGNVLSLRLMGPGLTSASEIFISPYIWVYFSDKSLSNIEIYVSFLFEMS